MPSGKWLDGDVRADPRPYGPTLFGDGLLRPGYFEAKNRLWKEHGISLGGYYAPDVQGGSRDGSFHGMAELLLLATWAPIRRENQSGRVVVGFAYDHTIGDLTTRKFANLQALVETPDDLDTDPNESFTTLGLLSWEHEFRFGKDAGVGYRVGQLFAASYFALTTYLDDDRRYFMARSLAAAAGAQWVGPTRRRSGSL